MKTGKGRCRKAVFWGSDDAEMEAAQREAPLLGIRPHDTETKAPRGDLFTVTWGGARTQPTCRDFVQEQKGVDDKPKPIRHE